MNGCTSCSSLTLKYTNDKASANDCLSKLDKESASIKYNQNKMKNSLLLKIIQAGLIVGTLDILSAFIYYFLKTGNKNVFIVLQYVASGAFGKEALSGGNKMMLAGLIFHYAIAFSFTVFFFWLFPKIKLASKNLLLTGIIYGLFVWTVMNMVVVPLSQIGPRPFNLSNAIINALILIVCIGIPLAFIGGKFYRRATGVAFEKNSSVHRTAVSQKQE
jgi:hypothetical protein